MHYGICTNGIFCVGPTSLVMAGEVMILIDPKLSFMSDKIDFPDLMIYKNPGFWYRKSNYQNLFP